MDFNRRATTDLTAKDIDFVSDRKTGRCMVVIGKPLAQQAELAAVQCAAATGLLTFVGKSGKRQTVKIPVKPPLLEKFIAAREVTVILVQDGNVADMHLLPLSVIHSQ